MTRAFLFGLLLVACSSTNGASPADAGADAARAKDAAQCSAARAQLLPSVAAVNRDDAAIVSDDGTTRVLYVDASAGGFDQARKNARVYLTLEGKRIDVSDLDAPSSTAWDIALKRQVIFTNSGDGGAGQGGAVLLRKPFASVTAGDASGVAAESFFDADCNAITDEISDPRTTFTGWYDYDLTTNRATPKPNTSFVVRSASGTDLWAVAILSYTGRPDGSTNAPSTGFYLLQMRKL